jgi:WD40 repeat protein
LYDLGTGLFLEKIFAHPKKSPVVDLQGNPRNKIWVAILFADQSCMVYNFGTKEVTELPVGTDVCPQSCGFITFHESLPNLLLLTGNRAIKVIDLDQKGKKSDLLGKEIWRLANTHKKDVTDMEITNDSKYAVSVSSDCTIKIYELEDNSIFAEKRFIDIQDKKKSAPKNRKPDSPRKPSANRRSELIFQENEDLGPTSPYYTGKKSSVRRIEAPSLINDFAGKKKSCITALSISEDRKYIVLGFINGDIGI